MTGRVRILGLGAFGGTMEREWPLRPLTRRWNRWP